MKVFINLPKSEVYAKAEYSLADNSCTVLKGSVVSKKVSDAPTFHGKKRIHAKRADFVKDFVLVEDVSFKSPSTAANFVMGKSTDGCNSWKDEMGRTIRQIKVILQEKKEDI